MSRGREEITEDDKATQRLQIQWTLHREQQGQEGYSGTTFRDYYLLQHAKRGSTVQKSSIAVYMNISMVNQDNSIQEVTGISVL